MEMRKGISGGRAIHGRDQWLSDALYVLVATIWPVPDLRIERMIEE